MPNFPIKTLHPGQPEYPRLLAELKNPPDPLYYRGVLPDPFFYIAFVGARKMTGYGQQTAQLLISGLAGLPICIVSGLAFGIDAQAHRCALKAGLPTVAVLGSGLDDDSIYPRVHRGLVNEILRAGGALISHFPPGTKAQDWHFPQRNEIISGLSRAVVVLEAAEKSGALITADFALHQSRDVFALPGSIFEKICTGANNLIKTGSAKLISNATDIIEEYPALLRFKKSTEPSSFADDSLPEIQRRILSKISLQPTKYSVIQEQTGLPASVLSANLVLLELANRIKRLDNNCYARSLTSGKEYG